MFILDRRQYGTQTLIKDRLSHLQGPAFLAYNDAAFSDADWEAIRTVSQSSKADDTEYVIHQKLYWVIILTPGDRKIGKHGLGSRAYYHVWPLSHDPLV